MSLLTDNFFKKNGAAHLHSYMIDYLTLYLQCELQLLRTLKDC